jgi:hypothetical protein
MSSICQGPKNTPRIPDACSGFAAEYLFSSSNDQSADTLVYETDHIQNLFLRTIETNLQEQELEITLKKKKYLMRNIF